MTIQLDGDLVAIVSSASTMVYAVVSAVSLLLLARQVRDARRFGAAPALYALLKELEDHTTAVRHLDRKDVDADTTQDTIDRYLEFLERVDHLRDARVVPVAALRRAFGPPLKAHLSDSRFMQAIEQGGRCHAEVLVLAGKLGLR